VALVPTATVAAVLGRWPELLDTFLAFGFTALAQPAMRETMGRVVTLEQACRRKEVDLAQFLAALDARRRASESSAEGACCQQCASQAEHAGT
jgi:hypothetical protein